MMQYDKRLKKGRMHSLKKAKFHALSEHDLQYHVYRKKGKVGRHDTPTPISFPAIEQNLGYCIISLVANV